MVPHDCLITLAGERIQQERGPQPAPFLLSP
jgi:hypothetical protein